MTSQAQATAGPLFHVVCNYEDQYSIWRADHPVPPGWECVGGPATKQDCLARVEELWTDMRPASVRRGADAPGCEPSPHTTNDDRLEIAMQTMRLGKLDFDEAELVAELEVSERFEYMEPYSEFLCGRPWKSCMLWAPGGDAGDGVIAHYDASRPSALTPYGRRMPHLAGLLEAHFSLDHLNFARLAVMTDSLLIPHRDYVEFDPVADPRTVAHRLHVALRTSADCMFLEGDVVFRMKAGEVWFLDVREVHSAAVLSDLRRVHLILDFTDAESMGDLVELHPEYEGIPQDSVCDRPPLGEEESEHLLALAGVLDMDNYRDVFGILIKKQYRRDGGKDFFWRTVEEIAGRTTDATVAEHVRGLARYYLMERAE